MNKLFFDLSSPTKLFYNYFVIMWGFLWVGGEPLHIVEYDGVGLESKKVENPCTRAIYLSIENIVMNECRISTWVGPIKDLPGTAPLCRAPGSHHFGRTVICMQPTRVKNCQGRKRSKTFVWHVDHAFTRVEVRAGWLHFLFDVDEFGSWACTSDAFKGPIRAVSNRSRASNWYA